MSGGSMEPEGDDDFQCSNCGLWFARVGISNHENGCDYPEAADPIVPLREPDEQPAIEGSGDPPAPDDVDEGADAQDARTDGAGLGLEGPPETSSDEEPSEAVDETDQEETLSCNGCGDDLGLTESELHEKYDVGDRPECTNCGHVHEVTDD